jgi:hypothetical protein
MSEEERGHQKLFSLNEAERTRLEVEPVLVEAIDCRRKLGEVDSHLAELANRIQMAGGLVVRFENAMQWRREHDRFAQQLNALLERIEETGCVVKDLDNGLIDFPAQLNGEEVYWCWRLGEDHIRFWHRQDEGFAGRKPIDPRDSGSGPPVQ